MTFKNWDGEDTIKLRRLSKQLRKKDQTINCQYILALLPVRDIKLLPEVSLSSCFRFPNTESSAVRGSLKISFKYFF